MKNLFSGFYKNEISTIKFIFIVIAINMILYNYPLYIYTIKHLSIASVNGFLTFLSIIILLFTISSFILFFIASLSPYIIKPLSILIFLSNSLALYFIDTYNVILDRTMMGNVFNTNLIESSSYLSYKIFIYIIIFGAIPSFLIIKLKLKKTKRLKLLSYSFGIFTIGTVLMYLNSQTWLWIDKNAKYIGALVMPWSYSINSIRYKIKKYKKEKKQILLPKANILNNNKMVVVLVIGESARADNFSLYGYKKETNPNLKKENILVLKNTFSTATYTTASVHSMLSYKGSDSDSYEPLPSYLQRIGIDVIWRTNNWGEPPLHVKSYERSAELRKKCQGNKCNFDEVLLTNLNKEILSSKKNKVFVVLHTAGSHGPTYYKKYPKEFEKFKPVCKTVDLKKCSKQELINAYDNTILYTDYFLYKTIETLKKLKDIPVLLIYISDHGESLGEYGLYLHGTPYTIAPSFQKHIPFIIWESKKFIQTKGYKKSYIKKQKLYGQNYIFHTILSSFDVNSTIYNKKYDLLSR